LYVVNTTDWSIVTLPDWIELPASIRAEQLRRFSPVDEDSSSSCSSDGSGDTITSSNCRTDRDPESPDLRHGAAAARTTDDPSASPEGPAAAAAQPPPRQTAAPPEPTARPPAARRPPPPSTGAAAYTTTPSPGHEIQEIYDVPDDE
jgi:hypothetical protein